MRTRTKRLSRRLILIYANLLVLLVAVPAPSLLADEPVRLRVLTYNIHHGQGVDGRFDLERLAAVIKKTDPDLAALQEVDRTTTRASGVNQAAVLGKLTHRFAFFGRAMSYAGGGYGEAVLSRRRPLAYGTHALPHSRGHEPRAALALRLRVKTGEQILFVGTHLDHVRDETDRLAQAQALDRIFASRRRPPVILAGDLNARPTSRPIQTLLKHWSDSAAAAPAPTFPSDQPTRRIDHILVWPPERWRVIATRVIPEEIASDHRPLLVVLELLPTAPGDRPVNGEAGGKKGSCARVTGAGTTDLPHGDRGSRRGPNVSQNDPGGSRSA